MLLPQGQRVSAPMRPVVCGQGEQTHAALPSPPERVASSSAQAGRKEEDEKCGHLWLFSHVKRSWSIGLLATLVVLVIAGSFYVLYNQFGSDIAPDSPAGYVYAISGTLCFIFAVVCYTMHRHSRKRRIGQLNAALNWHSFFAIMSIALLLMHSFGNFNTKTGTYALCGLIILTVSGFVGRALDRIMPQFIAREVSNMLTAQGEDCVEVGLRKLQALAIEPPPGHMARDELQYRFISDDKKSPPVHPGALLTPAQQIWYVQRATQREQFYRYVIRYWRILHITLALLAIGLIIWHLLYVVQLLISTLLH